jgi:hypothetical protein
VRYWLLDLSAPKDCIIDFIVVETTTAFVDREGTNRWSLKEMSFRQCKLCKRKDRNRSKYGYLIEDA